MLSIPFTQQESVMMVLLDALDALEQRLDGPGWTIEEARGGQTVIEIIRGILICQA